MDGGYLNNIPLHVFDHEKDGLRRTLGLRLEIEEAPQPIEHLGHFLLRWPVGFGFMGAGEAHVGRGTRNDSQAITLDTEGLSLFQFSAPPDKIDAVSKRSRDEVLGYFDPKGRQSKPGSRT